MPQPSPVLMGVPCDQHSSYLRGAAQAPGAVRKALFCPSSNLWTETGQDLGTPDALHDAGDMILTGRDNLGEIADQAKGLFASGRSPVFIGGDHFVSWPLLRGLKASGLAGESAPTVIQFDAHPDTYDQFEGNRHSHACPFARIMEEGLAGRLVQIGIRTATGHQREQAARFGIETHYMKDYAKAPDLDLQGPVYVSVDMDALDPAFAPGVSHLEPGGLTMRQILDVIHSIPVPILGADVVELNPSRDRGDITAFAAAKLVKELAGMMLST